MDIIRVLTEAFQSQNRVNEDYNEPLAESELANADNDLACEQQIIKCQLQNDRLLGSTSKALRAKYGDSIVDRTISRLKTRRRRGKCSVKAEKEKYLKIFKPIIETYFKKKTENDHGNGL